MHYNQVEKEFLTKQMPVRSNILILSGEDAISFIKRCEELQFEIYGIDAFKIYGMKIQPVMEESIDFEESEGFHQYLDAIEHITKRLSKGLCFEVVCGQHRKPKNGLQQ